MILENTQAIQTPQYDERILNFLEYIVLMLSQADTVEEIDLIMDDFLSDDIMKVLTENSGLFSVLAVVWIDTFERVCMQKDETDFSLKALYLPIMFKLLGWTITDHEKLKRLHVISLENAEKTSILCPILVLLFIEGFILTPSQALANFEQAAKKLSTSEEDDTNIQKIISDVISLGWGH